jgi:hypothetical protein
LILNEIITNNLSLLNHTHRNWLRVLLITIAFSLLLIVLIANVFKGFDWTNKIKWYCDKKECISFIHLMGECNNYGREWRV